MGIFSKEDRKFAEVLSQLAYANPFQPRRIELEREALGSDFDDPSPVWSHQVGLEDDRPNVLKLAARVEPLSRPDTRETSPGRQGE